MRDGHYDVKYATTLVELCRQVNAGRNLGYTPQAQPFKYGGNICQVMTKVDNKPMKDDTFVRECNRRGVTPIDNKLVAYDDLLQRNRPI